MKRWMEYLCTARKNGRRLVALCYAAFLAGSLLFALYGVAEDGVRRLTGDVRRIEIDGAQTGAFTLLDLEQDGACYTSTSIDPRMEMALSVVSPDAQAVYVRSVTLYFRETNMDPGEICVFYKPKPNMPEYDAIYRVWAHKESPNVYRFTLPMGKLYGIRIDPSIYSGFRFDLDRVVLNEPRTLLDRLTPTRPWLLAAAAVPPLAASALWWIFRAWERRTEKRRAKGNS